MQIYRKRFEPEECVLLKDDTIVYSDKSYICTKWDTLKPRNDFDGGVSIYDIDHGVKVSKIYKDGGVVYYYIDIIGMEYNQADDTYLCTDYVLDIVLQPDLKTYKVLDEDELDMLIAQGVFTTKQVTEIYVKLNFMKDCINNWNFAFYLELFKNVGL